MRFWQIPLAAESTKYTTFITPFGCYYLNRLPFGITSTLELFFAEQTKNTKLCTVLDRLPQAGVPLNVKKCELGSSTST